MITSIFSFSNSAKASGSIYSTDDGIIIELSESHSANALYPILLSVFGSSTLFNDLHSSKAESSIVLTPSHTTTVSRFAQTLVLVIYQP